MALVEHQGPTSGCCRHLRGGAVRIVPSTIQRTAIGKGASLTNRSVYEDMSMQISRRFPDGRVARRKAASIAIVIPDPSAGRHLNFSHLTELVVVKMQ